MRLGAVAAGLVQARRWRIGLPAHRARSSVHRQLDQTSRLRIHKFVHRRRPSMGGRRAAATLPHAGPTLGCQPCC